MQQIENSNNNNIGKNVGSKLSKKSLDNSKKSTNNTNSKDKKKVSWAYFRSSRLYLYSRRKNSS